jgi:hypothetical protein
MFKCISVYEKCKFTKHSYFHMYLFNNTTGKWHGQLNSASGINLLLHHRGTRRRWCRFKMLSLLFQIQVSTILLYRFAHALNNFVKLQYTIYSKIPKKCTFNSWSGTRTHFNPEPVPRKKSQIDVNARKGAWINYIFALTIRI